MLQKIRHYLQRKSESVGQSSNLKKTKTNGKKNGNNQIGKRKARLSWIIHIFRSKNIINKQTKNRSEQEYINSLKEILVEGVDFKVYLKSNSKKEDSQFLHDHSSTKLEVDKKKQSKYYHLPKEIKSGIAEKTLKDEVQTNNYHI